MLSSAPTRNDGKRLHLTVLGGFEARWSHGPPLIFPAGKVQALLASLALPPGRAHPRDKLAALLWGSLGEAEARASLRQALFTLRRALPAPKILITEGDNVALEPTAVEVDAAWFERRVAEGTPAALEEAAELYHGDLLAGLAVSEPAFEEWLLPERERIRELAIEALAKLLTHQRGVGVRETAVQTGLRLLALDPLAESVHRTLMRLYVELGRRPAALRQSQRCVALLQRELDAEPEAETRRLYEEIVRERPVSRRVEVSVSGAIPESALEPPSTASFSGMPMVGRDTERRRLGSLLDETLAGRGRVAIVRGNAGIGKTRLAVDLAAAAASRGARVLLGRSYQSEQILPFGPWVDALRTVRLTNAALEHLDPIWRSALARLLPELGGTATTETPDHRLHFEAVAQLVAHLAVPQPLVLILEDVHWADEMSLGLLAFVGRRLPHWPVLVVATAREEELVDAPALRRALDDLDREARLDHVPLGPLTEPETTALVTALARPGSGTDATERLAARLWATSEGNPFMVVETLRAMREAATPDAASALALPDRVREMLLRRLARLGERGRQVVAFASVIGREFDFDLLQQATGLDDREAAQVVEELVRRHVFHGVGERLDFTHDLIRAVAYDQLATPQRRLLHRLVAVSIEHACGTDTTGHDLALSTHYRQAEVWDKACEYQARVGFQAYARGASREALVSFEEALQALARLPDTAERRELGVRMRLAVNGALAGIGAFGSRRDHLYEAEKLGETLSDRRWAGRVATALSNSYRASGMLDRALSLGQRALEIARETDDRLLESVARYALGRAEHNVGNFRRSLEHLATLLSEDTRNPDLAGLPALRAEARYWMVYNHALLGEFDGALRVIDEAFRESDTQVDPLGMQRLLAHISLGKLHTETADTGAAVRAFEDALAMYREDYHRNWYAPLAWGLGLAYARAGRVGEGLELLEKAESFAREIDPNTMKTFRLYHLGWAFIQAGRLDEAGRAVSDALRLAHERGERWAQSGGHWLLGEIARLRDPVARDEMERHVLDALVIAEALEMRPVAARCHLRLAWIYNRAGRPERDRHRAAARALLEQMGGHLKLDAVDEETLA